jgi:hypothetical protein
MPISPGQEWGGPITGPPDVTVDGNDADLAAAVAAHPGGLVRFTAGPDSDVARAVALDGREPEREVPVDALRLDEGILACNMIVLGTPPDRLRRMSSLTSMTVTVDGREIFDGGATTVVVATGQYLRGLDVVPRGHPGDGRAEIQVYAVPSGERKALRARLASGTHIPHPAITQTTGRRVEITTRHRFGLEVDGRPVKRRTLDLTIEIVPSAYRLLV